MAALVLPSLGVGLAVGRCWAVALPFLVVAPFALAGEDGSNAFSYRLPALALAVIALATAVLALTGVLLGTGRFSLPAYMGVALVFVGAVPLVWAGYRHVRPLNERGDLLVDVAVGSFEGVALGDSRNRVVMELGAPSNSPGTSIAPAGQDFVHIGGPPFIATPGSKHESLRYAEASVLLSDDRVYGLVLTDKGAETTEGVGVGDSLEVAEDAYPGLDCGVARPGKYRTFPYCGGRLSSGRWIWLGQDPIRSIVLTRTELGAD